MREMVPGNPVIVGPAVNIDCPVLMPGPKFPAQKHILDALLRQDFFKISIIELPPVCTVRCGPDIRQDRDSILLQNTQEIIQAMGRITNCINSGDNLIVHVFLPQGRQLFGIKDGIAVISISCLCNTLDLCVDGRYK